MVTGHEVVVVEELVHRHQLHRRHPQPLQVLDDGGMGEHSSTRRATSENSAKLVPAPS
jgi:hypothetical protein